jgi:hypothetical protein
MAAVEMLAVTEPGATSKSLVKTSFPITPQGDSPADISYNFR